LPPEATETLLDKPIFVTSKVLADVGTIAPEAETRISKRPTFFVSAELFHPEFRPIPKPVNSGERYALANFVASAGLDLSNSATSP